MSTTKRILDFFIHVASCHRCEVFLVSVLMIVTSLLEGLGMSLLFPLVDVLTGKNGGGSSIITEQLTAWLSGPETTPSPEIFLGLVLTAFFLQYLFLTALGWFAASLQNDFVASWRNRLLELLVNARWKFFTTHSSGKLTALFMSETQRLGSCIYSIIQILSTVIVSMMYVAISVMVSWRITSVLVAAALLLALSSRPIVRLGSSVGSRITRETMALTNRFEEFVSIAKMLKVTSTTKRYAQDIERDVHTLKDTYVHLSFHPVILRVFLEFSGLTCLSLTLVYGSSVEALTPASMFVVLALFARLYPRISQIPQNWQLLLLNLSAWDTVNGLYSAARADIEHLRYGHIQVPEKGHHICFDHVSAGYDGVPVLNHVSIDIPSGACVAIVGQSGAGKSTLVDCIMGLIEVQTGTILIDGTPLKDLPIGTWREKVGYVGQETLLLDRSVRENIAWGGVYDDEEAIREAARSASADDFIMDMPDGYDTRIGPRGVRLSGGQKQRLGIARALNRETGLLILDEATSALDTITEQEVLSAIRQLRGRMTIIMIAHRLSTVSMADLIFVLAKGRVVEQGKWSDLARGQGQFNTMLERQQYHA